MAILTMTTDEKARLVLPKGFASSTVLVEQVSETELRVRKARVIAEDDLAFIEEATAPLSDRDRDIFFALLDNPPPPNNALRHLLSAEDNDRGQREGDNGGLPDLSVELASLSWPAFFARVSAEQHSGQPLVQERLQVLREIRRSFSQAQHFCDLDYVGRRKIAGLLKSANPNFLLFGSMQWVGHFKQAIKENNEGISLAMDEIPLEGDITREHYQRFTDKFLKSFKRSGMALASRLLAMKRPDHFVCVNNQNREGLFQAFHLASNRDAATYWDLIQRIRACKWWNAPPPSAADKLEIWRARAAFLDALFYSGMEI